MKRNALLIQLVSIALLVGVVVLVTIGRDWFGGDPARGTEGGTAQAPPAAHASSRVFYGNLGPLVAVLAPLHREKGPVAFDLKWLDAALGREPGRSGYLFLHLFHRGDGGAAAFDPLATRTELRSDETWGPTDQPLGRVVAQLAAGGKLASSEALYLRTVAPAGPIRVPVNGVVRLLLAFDRLPPWARLEGARLRLPEGPNLGLRSAVVSDVDWESLLSGGLIPDALATDVQLEASLPTPK